LNQLKPMEGNTGRSNEFQYQWGECKYDRRWLFTILSNNAQSRLHYHPIHDNYKRWSQ
jgi:hypothetical protein